MSLSRWTIMKKLVLLILFAFLVSVSVLAIAITVTSHVITSREWVLHSDEKIRANLEQYIEKENLRTDDFAELAAWCGSNRGLDMEVFVDGILVFSSFADLGELQTLVRETELDQKMSTPVKFADTTADVLLYDYLYIYENAVVVEVLAAVALFIIIILTGIRKGVDYVKRLNDEIHTLEGGDLTKEITVRGSDEIALLAESIDEFRKSMKNQLNTIERLEKTNRMTLAEIAHDLRTPLTSLMMYLDFALSEVHGSEPQAEEYLIKAKEKSIRLKNLLDENYSYTTMTDYFLEEKQEVQAEAVLTGFINDFAVNLESRGFHVISDLSFGQSGVLLQRDALGRIFGNLATNIFKYAEEEGDVYICGRDQGTHVEVRIENAIRVFEGEKPPSTGFGSRIVKRLMEEMNGEYYSEEMEGRYMTILRFLKAEKNSRAGLGNYK